MARKFLVPIDFSKNEFQNAVAQNLASAPSSPVAGQVYFDTVLHEFGIYSGSGWVYVGSGGGTVTTVSVASANGFAGSVANATSTPAITVSTSITGILKGNGTAVSAASSGTDYAPATSGSSALKGNGSGGFGAAVLNDVGAATGDYSVNSHKLTSLADPTSAQDAATKAYVDAVAQGLSVKPAARAATTGSETYTVSAGSVTVIAGTTVDGVSPAVNDYILVKDAPASSGAGSPGSSQPGNGLYQVTNATTNLTISRAAAMSGSNGPAGAFVFTEAGTVNASAGYVVSTPSTNSGFTYGTNNIQWTQFSGAGEVTAGAGLAKSGNTLSIENSGVLTVTHGGTGAATLTGLVKGNGTSAMTAATAGTDYAAATSGSSILKGNGAGGFSSAKFTATIGDGSTTAIAVTHSLGTQDVIAQVRDASTNAVVDCDITQTSTSVTTFTFTVAPASNAYKVVIIG